MAGFLYKKNNKVLNIVNFDYSIYNNIVGFLNKDSLLSKKLFFNKNNGIYSDSVFLGEEVRILANDFYEVSIKLEPEKYKHLLNKISEISFKLYQLYNFDNEATLLFISD